MNSKRPGSWGCEACSKGFRSLSAFDRHRTGHYASGKKPSTRRCLSTGEMHARGMALAPNGAWMSGRTFDQGKLLIA
jgi:hypothetical protein